MLKNVFQRCDDILGRDDSSAADVLIVAWTFLMMQLNTFRSWLGLAKIVWATPDSIVVKLPAEGRTLPKDPALPPALPALPPPPPPHPPLPPPLPPPEHPPPEDEEPMGPTLSDVAPDGAGASASAACGSADRPRVVHRGGGGRLVLNFKKCLSITVRHLIASSYAATSPEPSDTLSMEHGQSCKVIVVT